ncbi:hypothetical protein NDU88_007079 [Pleurodeles waltl]|uniref:Uncharacterized protein n=1 Tax=Pleurodeles waltl TaxID=8319 RepID=A0AAV7VSI8_PLEWA|nr:hypothetical protein NDU88_007079 [Pleurodeles waltl]
MQPVHLTRCRQLVPLQLRQHRSSPHSTTSCHSPGCQLPRPGHTTGLTTRGAQGQPQQGVAAPPGVPSLQAQNIPGANYTNSQSLSSRSVCHSLPQASSVANTWPTIQEAREPGAAVRPDCRSALGMTNGRQAATTAAASAPSPKKGPQGSLTQDGPARPSDNQAARRPASHREPGKGCGSNGVTVGGQRSIMTTDWAPCLTPQADGDAAPSRAARAKGPRRVPVSTDQPRNEADCLRRPAPQIRRLQPVRLNRSRGGTSARHPPAALSPKKLRPDRRNGQKGPQPQ